jgi:predicted ABC-type ATPase
MKKYVIIAGVNGAGKTTFYSMEDTFENLKKINLDEVVREIGNWKNRRDVIEAGKIVVNRINEYFEKGISFSQETTLCGKSIINNIRKAKELGYYIELCYLGLDSPETAKKRVQNRVRNGGHGISEEDIERRYYESLKNMEMVLPMCNKATIYDNSDKLVRLAYFESGACEWSVRNLPEWIKEILA